MDKDFQITFGNPFKNELHGIYFRAENEYSSAKWGFYQWTESVLKIKPVKVFKEALEHLFTDFR